MSKVADAKEMDQYCDPKGLQEKSRKARFASNGEPSEAVGYEKQRGLKTESHKPGDALVAERALLLTKGKGNVSNLSGAFDSVDDAAASFKSADSGTRS
jgi:hypothetical protein